MKIVYFATYYEAYLESFYRKNPGFSTRSYTEQNAKLREDHFGAFGSYTDYAIKHGHEAHLIAANCRPMQEQWAHENNFTWNENDWSFSVAAAQVKKIKPDIFFTGSMFPYYGSFLDEITPYCKKITGWISCPVPEGTPYRKLSLILTSAPHYVDLFRKAGAASELLLPAFDKDILDYLDRDAEANDISFIGSLSNYHRIRNEYLQQLVKKTGIRIYGISGTNSRREKLFNLFKHDPLKKHLSGPVFGNAMYSILAKSKISFNIHIDFMKDYAGNMRMFEATGAGSLLLTDHKKNVHTLFEPGREIITYTSPEDAAEKANYYLHHEEERRKIAQAGHARTLNDYNFDITIKKMLELFGRQLNGW